MYEVDLLEIVKRALLFSLPVGTFPLTWQSSSSGAAFSCLEQVNGLLVNGSRVASRCVHECSCVIIVESWMF